MLAVEILISQILKNPPKDRSQRSGLIAAAGTEGFLIPDSIIAMPFKGILLMQNYGWIWESTAILLMIIVAVLFFANMKMEEERAALWN